jgi:hypothetical protein
LVLQCINGVSSNPVEGRAKICQLTDLILTLFGLIFRRIYQMAMVFSLLNNLLSFLYHGQDVYSTCLWVTRRIFYPSRTPKLTPCFTIENTWVNPVFYPSRTPELTPCLPFKNTWVNPVFYPSRTPELTPCFLRFVLLIFLALYLYSFVVSFFVLCPMISRSLGFPLLIASSVFSYT